MTKRPTGVFRMSDAPRNERILMFTVQHGWLVGHYDPDYWRGETGPYGWSYLPDRLNVPTTRGLADESV